MGGGEVKQYFLEKLHKLAHCTPYLYQMGTQLQHWQLLRHSHRLHLELLSCGVGWAALSLNVSFLLK